MTAMKPIGALGCKLPQICIAAVVLGLLPLEAGAGPDLTIAGGRASKSIEYRHMYFTAGDCAYQEGCVRGTGRRKLLLLDMGIKNVGTRDLVIGDPLKRPDLFVWSGCHGHFHLKNLAVYRVIALDGRQVAKSYKQGFCLRDDTPKDWNAGAGKYTCDYQGLSVGWQDTYDKSLECQWVDITGVKPGSYYLEVTVNPNHVLPESNYANNKIILRITVPKYVGY